MKISILQLMSIACSLWPYSAEAQFPRACTTDGALKRRECCPETVLYDEVSRCGEAQGRGSCVTIKTPILNLSAEMFSILALDERSAWPTVFFDRACECKGNFDGVDCGKCKPGFEGEQCGQKSPKLVRRNILNMPRPEVQKFVSYVDESKHTTSEEYVILVTSYDRILSGEKPQFSNVSMYDLFVWMHYYVARSNFVMDLGNGANNGIAGGVPLDDIKTLLADSPELFLNGDHDYAHEGPAFLPWHRYFLLKWEEQIREVIANDPTFAIPYWDWRESESCDVCNDLMLGARSDENESLISPESPFSGWKITCSRGDQYILDGRQCDGKPEGALLRNYGAYDETVTMGIPSSKDVENSLRYSAYEMPPYDISANQSFRNVIEGFADPEDGAAQSGYSTMHNAVHLYMNGTMSQVGSSANDPIFILHHAFIDSIYERWLHDQSQDGILAALNQEEIQEKPGHRPHDYMVPFFPLVEQIEGFKFTRDLGYEYDYVIAEQNADNQQGLEASGGQVNSPTDYSYETTLDNAPIGEGNFGSNNGEGTRHRHVHPKPSHATSKHKSPVTRGNIRGRLGEGGIRIAKHPVNRPANMGTEFRPTQRGPVDVSSEISTAWGKFITYSQDWQRYYQSQSTDVKVLLVLLPLMSVGSVVALVFCCTCQGNQDNPSKKVSKGSGNKCLTVCCCKGVNESDEEESQALLESSSGKIKKKTVSAKSYTREEDDMNPFCANESYQCL